MGGGDVGRGREFLLFAAEGLKSAQVGVFLDALGDLIVPGDEMVLEAAVNGQVHAIVTFNLHDYGVAPNEFGVDVMLPRDALRKVQRIKG